MENRTERNEDIKIDEQILRCVYKECTGSELLEVKHLYWSVYNFDANKFDYFYNKMEQIGLRFIQRLNISGSRNVKVAKKFLRISFIKEMSIFSFISPHLESKKYRCFHKQVLKFLPRVTKHISLQCCQINKNQFRKIIQIGRHIENIDFVLCNITFAGLKLTESLVYSIKSICFYFFNDPQIQPVKEIIESLRNFIQAASATSIKTSLIKIYTDIPTAKLSIRNYAKELGFRNI
ncbi:unnamed protein product [Moneuplotes crassus]|uniref:Uncharacterized protein n=1 Tax=Euplotes crassus TaxID=5936 RepID=A0AAD1XVZ7_EUPCR|nr:unnamed protein product [Moneuplotes crassus]